jgi:hypothetical protein
MHFAASLNFFESLLYIIRRQAYFTFMRPFAFTPKMVGR